MMFVAEYILLNAMLLGGGGVERLPYNLKCPIYLRATGVHVNESTAEAGLELQPRVASFYAHLLECKDRVASQT